MKDFFEKYKELIICLIIIIIITTFQVIRINKVDSTSKGLNKEMLENSNNSKEENETYSSKINLDRNTIKNENTVITKENIEENIYKEFENNYNNSVENIINSNQNISSQPNINQSVNKQNTTISQDSTQSNTLSVFLSDFTNYNETSTETLISKTKAKEIAEKGFKEAERIAEVGTPESETMTICNQCANNFFTRKTYEGDKIYTNINRKVYAFQRENEMCNGVTVYVDVTTGLIIGGRAFGD